MLGKKGSKVGDAPWKYKYSEFIMQTLEIKPKQALTVFFSAVVVRVLQWTAPETQWTFSSDLHRHRSILTQPSLYLDESWILRFETKLATVLKSRLKHSYNYEFKYQIKNLLSQNPQHLHLRDHLYL